MISSKRLRKEKLLSYFILALMAVLLVSFVSAQDSTMDIVTYGQDASGNSFGDSNIDVNTYATSFEFVAGAYSSDIEMCSCGTNLDRIFITNTGSFGAIFTLSTNLPDLVTLPASTLALETKQSIILDLLISAPCGETINEEYNVTISSNLGKEKVITKTLSTIKCQSIESELFVDKDEFLPCEPINYKLDIKNPANFAETYYIEPLNYIDFFNASLYELKLPQGKTGVVQTTLKLNCDQYGLKETGFKIYSANNDLTSELYHSFNVLQAYNFSTNLADSYTACEDEWKEIPITIINEATVSNGYTIELIDAPKFVSLDRKHVDVGASSEKMFALFVEPGKKQSGDYSFTVRMGSDIGDTVIEKRVNLSVSDCYKLSVTILGDENPNVCSGEKVFTAIIKNEGSFTEEIKLYPYYDVQRIGVLSDDLFELDAGEEKKINITLDIPEDLDKEFSVFLTAKELNNVNKEWKDSITIKPHNNYDCTKTQLSNSKVYARYTDSQAILKIKNTGFVGSEYILFLEGEDKLELSEDVVYLSAGEEKQVVLNIDKEAETEDNFFYLKIISEKNGEVYEYDFELALSDNPIYEKIYAYSITSTCKTVGSILVILLIIALIVLFARILIKNSTYKGQGRFNIVLLILIILVAILALAIFGLPDHYAQPLEQTQDLSIVWYEDSIKTINMSDYFVDPDGDSLSFKVEDEPEEVLINFDGEIATLTPEPDWFGNRRIRFIATDSDGVSLKSPRITIEVVDYPEFDLSEIHSIYCVYINAILLILLLLILILTPFHKKPKLNNGKVAKINIEKEKGYFYFVDSEGDVSRKKIKRSNGKKK